MEVLDDSPCPVSVILDLRSTGQTDQEIPDHLEIEDRNLLIFVEFANLLQYDLCSLEDKLQLTCPPTSLPIFLTCISSTVASSHQTLGKELKCPS